MEDPGLTVWGGRRQPAEPTTQGVVLFAHHLGDFRAISQLDRPAQLLIRQGVDLQRDQATPPVAWSPLSAKDAIFQPVVPAEKPAARGYRVGAGV